LKSLLYSLYLLHHRKKSGLDPRFGYAFNSYFFIIYPHANFEERLLNTTVKNWYIVGVMDGRQLIGEVLYAIVQHDQTFRFFEGDYVTTSRIVSMDTEAQLVITSSHSQYQLIGKGKKAIIDLDDFELLRHGFSPEQIRTLNSSSPL
jgi:hypothetical protein|tara:strand:- start:1704 stop:2144 length:441 start_codon:yes stop_codon:yes gene_type:complete